MYKMQPEISAAATQIRHPVNHRESALKRLFYKAVEFFCKNFYFFTCKIAFQQLK